MKDQIELPTNSKAKVIIDLVDTLIASVNEAHHAHSCGWRDGCFRAADSAYEKIKTELLAIEADRKRRGEPVAFSYELATTRSGDGEYTHWSPRLSYSMPNVPDGSIRNLQWLYVDPQPAAPAKEVSDEEIKTLSYAFNKVEGNPSHFHAVFDCVGFARALLARYGSKS